jgi:ribonuclease HI
MKIQKEVVIYTDGACIGNPGRGGYAAILIYGKHRKEITGGFRHTTNNRMEIIAVIEGLKSLKDNPRLRVNIFTDSRLLYDSINKGWVFKWKANKWKRNKKDKAINIDLWEKLLSEMSKHDVNFNWIPGHSGITENERCDELCNDAANAENLPPDIEYEKSITNK